MEFQNVSKNALKEWYISRTILFLICLGAFIGLFFPSTMTHEEKVIQIIFLIIVGMVTAWLFIFAFIFPSMKYKRLKYRINHNLIEKTSGIIFLRKQYVPFVRIQHVEVFRGIFDRIFGMSTLMIFTAGSWVRIPNLDIKQADELVLNVRKLLEEVEYGDKND